MAGSNQTSDAPDVTMILQVLTRGKIAFDHMIHMKLNISSNMGKQPQHKGNDTVHSSLEETAPRQPHQNKQSVFDTWSFHVLLCLLLKL